MRNGTIHRPAVAVLGTGHMGVAIAARLLAEGFALSVWNRTQARAVPLADAGARVARSPSEAVRGVDVVITMLADGEAVRDVMIGQEGAAPALGAGRVWIQMSTVGVAWTEHLASVARDHDLLFIDAPVSGSDGPAREGQLDVLASGRDGGRERVAPILDAVGRQTLWLGDAGSGTKLKPALNNWLAAQVEAAAETIGLAEALGVDPALFVDVIAAGPLGSPYAVAKATAMLDGDFVDLPLTKALAERWQAAIVDGHGADDVASVIAEPHSAHSAQIR